MQTRCPACHTLYRIDDDVLQRAGGQARCFRCDTVFEARPAEDEADLPVGDLVQPAEDPLELGDEHLPEPVSDSTDLDELGALQEIPDADALGGDSELDLSSLSEELRRPEAGEAENDALDLDIAEFAEQTPEPPPVADDLREEPPFDIPDDMPLLEPAAEAAPSIEQSLEAPPAEAPSRWPAVGVVLLVLLALGQLAWQLRQPILATPAGRGIAEGVCDLAGCQLPPRRAPSRYVVLERNIAPVAGREGVLALHLSFRNSAEFAQPLPDVQLSLYDSEERLMARRRLHPDEYLFPAPPAGTLVESGGLLQVDLQLEDPGRRATGFKLEFL
jgi:predicted Zn finger-like uncharacterized protein